MVWKLLIGLYVADTVLTAMAVSHGRAVEVNPLYWSFHDNVLMGLLTRMALGVGLFYWLRKKASRELLGVVAGVYGLLLMWMVGINYAG